MIDEKFGRDKGLEVGDTFTTGTASGRKIDYTVRGTFYDRADFYGDFVASDVNAAAYGEGDTVQQVLVNLDDGADVEAVRADLDRALAQLPDGRDQGPGASSRTSSRSRSTSCSGWSTRCCPWR